MATRYSWSFSSRGIPTCIWNAPSARRLSPSLGLTGQATSGHRPSLRDWRPLARAPFMGWRSARGPPPRGIRRRPAGRVRRPHASAPEPIEPEGDQRLGVAGGPGAGERERLLVGEPDDLHAGLLPVGLGAVAVDRPDALGQEQVDHLVAPAGRGVEGGEPGERAALDPQLLGQLPPQRVLDLLTADVVLAGGDLDQAPPDGVAPLVDQEDGALLVDHQGGRRAGVLDHLARAGAPVRAGDAVHPHVHDVAVERPFAVEHLERRLRAPGHPGRPSACWWAPFSAGCAPLSAAGTNSAVSAARVVAGSWTTCAVAGRGCAGQAGATAGRSTRAGVGAGLGAGARAATGVAARRSASRASACSAAAPTKSRNSGCGRVGRERSSGWNWPAM